LPRDQKLALRAMHKCLEEGGRLVCPLHNPAIRAGSADRALRLDGTFPTADGGLLIVSGFETLDEGSGVAKRVQLYELFDASKDLCAKRVPPMRFALIDRERFAELADAAGLVPVALYGDYDRGEYAEDSSPFMIVAMLVVGHLRRVADEFNGQAPRRPSVDEPVALPGLRSR
jgi:hypothetical protein